MKQDQIIDKYIIINSNKTNLKIVTYIMKK